MESQSGGHDWTANTFTCSIVTERRVLKSPAIIILIYDSLLVHIDDMFMRQASLDSKNQPSDTIAHPENLPVKTT